MKSIIYFLAVLLLFSCKPREQKINPEDIKGSWAASEAVMFTSLDVSDSSILVGNRADTIFTVRYSISHDTLITYAPFTNQQFKNRIILLTKDTLVLDGIMNVKEERHYSRLRVKNAASNLSKSLPPSAESISTQTSTNSDSLKKIEFWNTVITPIFNHDKSNVLSNMDFPVFGHWTKMMELNKTPREATREDFARVYDHFFNTYFIEELKKMKAKDINIFYRDAKADTTWFSFYVGRKLGLGEGGLGLVYFSKDGKFKLKNVQGAGGNFYYDEFAKRKN